MNEKFFAPEKRETKALVEIESARAIQEVQAAMVIAQKFPRSVEDALDKIKKACQRKSLAKEAVYAYNRGGTMISDASIRLAEVIMQNWGNMVAGIRELTQRDNVSEVEAFAWDLETNVKDTKTFHVKHERKAHGSYTVLEDPRDKYEHVANLATRRKRACILAVIPRDIKEQAVKWCEEALERDEAPIQDRVRNMLEKFAEMGIDRKMIEKRINHKIDAIIPQELVGLGKIYNSINDGMSNREDWFDISGAPTTDELKEKIEGLDKKKGEVVEKITKDPRAQAIEMIKDTFPPDLIKKAKEELKFATGHGAWPQDVVGCGKLFDKCQELYEKGDGK